MDGFTASELAERVSGRVEGDGGRTVHGVAAVEDAGEGDLTFVVGEPYARALERSSPSVVLAPAEVPLPAGDATVIRVEDPRAAFGRLVRLFRPEEDREPGIDPTAVIRPGAEVGEGVSVGAYAVVQPGAEVGRGSHVGSHTVVHGGARVGRDCEIHDGCTVRGCVRMGDRVRVLSGARLGTEGFGYAGDGEDALRFPQVGRCVIGDDVEVGANVTVDRGALRDTVVGARTKIDNLVHIGHNVRIGEDCMIVAQVGVAGSVEVGDGVQLGGQAGIAGHLTIGDGARIAARAGVIGDVPAGATYSGYPARPHAEAMRASAETYRLRELRARVRELEDAVRALEGDGDGRRG
ncbi:MAG: UDP-3-O-(3-hydroxymyristoyl)glucosamine N-acyltransferase [Gemmatimonadota bacterium]